MGLALKQSGGNLQEILEMLNEMWPGKATAHQCGLQRSFAVRLQTYRVQLSCQQLS